MSNSAWAPEDRARPKPLVLEERDRKAFLSFWQAKYYTLREATLDEELDAPGMRLACYKSWTEALRWADGRGSCYITPKLRHE